MTTTPPPEQRRALQRAADRDIHPIAPSPDDIAEAAAVTPRRKGKPGDVAVRTGRSTADAVSANKDKLVRLDVKVPKSLRTALRDEAERRGMTVDQLVQILLGDRTTR